MDPTASAEHAETHEHGSAAADAFSAEEWKEFRTQDLAAGKYIVGLMLGIFTLGLLLYTGVALWVHARVV